MNTFIKIPGNPDGPENEDEFAWHAPVILGYIMDNRQEFFDKLTFLEPIRRSVEGAIDKLIGRRVLEPRERKLVMSGTCSKCSGRMLNGFARGVATQFQVAFLRCWEDPIMRPSVINQLGGYAVAHPVSTLRWKVAVVNVRRRNGETMKCVVYKKGAGHAY